MDKLSTPRRGHGMSTQSRIGSATKRSRRAVVAVPNCIRSSRWPRDMDFQSIDGNSGTSRSKNTEEVWTSVVIDYLVPICKDHRTVAIQIPGRESERLHRRERKQPNDPASKAARSAREPSILAY